MQGRTGEPSVSRLGGGRSAIVALCVTIVVVVIPWQARREANVGGRPASAAMAELVGASREVLAISM